MVLQRIKKHTKKFDAVTSIRDNLGVKFSDFFNISGPALFVEGITDKNYISQILKISSNHDEYKEHWPYHCETFNRLQSMPT